MPERELWRAVIVQALLDATAPLPQLDATHPGRRIDADLDRAATRRWLLTPTTDFLAVCMMAGLPSGMVRRKAGECRAKGWTL